MKRLGTSQNKKRAQSGVGTAKNKLAATMGNGLGIQTNL